MPIYDFKESRRVGYRTVPVPESRVVILEGIYALNSRLRPQVGPRPRLFPRLPLHRASEAGCGACKRGVPVEAPAAAW